MKRSKQYGLTGQLAKIVDAAAIDPDPVSMMTLGDGPGRSSECSVVVIEGHQAIEAFRRWAEAQGILNPERSSGMAEVIRR